MSDIYHMTPTDTCKSGDFRKVTTNGMTAYQCVDTPDIIGQVKEVFTMLGYILGPIIFLTCMYWIYIRKCRRRVHPELVVTTNIPPSNNTIINVENENPQVISNDKKDETKVDETKVEEPKKEEPKEDDKDNNDKYLKLQNIIKNMSEQRAADFDPWIKVCWALMNIGIKENIVRKRL